MEPSALLAHIVDELDPCIGSKFPQPSVIGGIVGVGELFRCTALHHRCLSSSHGSG
jgi:hypothetical protein